MTRSAAQALRRLAAHGVLGISIIIIAVFALVGIGFAAGRVSTPSSAPSLMAPVTSVRTPAPPSLRWMQAHRADVRWMQDHWGQWQWMRAHMGDVAWMRQHPAQLGWMRAHPVQWQWMREHMGDIMWMHNHWDSWNSWRSGMMSGPGTSGGHRHGGNGWCDWGC